MLPAPDLGTRVAALNQIEGLTARRSSTLFSSDGRWTVDI